MLGVIKLIIILEDESVFFVVVVVLFCFVLFCLGFFQVSLRMPHALCWRKENIDENIQMLRGNNHMDS